MFYSYARVSTLDQDKDDRVSIGEQVNRCQAVATMRGVSKKYEFRSYIDRGVSGSVPLYKRPGGKQMLEQAEQGDVICASKLDRIFRSASDALGTIERLKKKGIGLIICDMGIDPVGDSPATSMFFGMLSLVAQFERERIHERITEGKTAKKARGGFIGGLPPFGYKKVGTGRQSELVRCERECAHILRARELYDEAPTTWREISSQLAREEMVGRNGEPYGQMAISRMIEASRQLKKEARIALPVAQESVLHG